MKSKSNIEEVKEAVTAEAEAFPAEALIKSKALAEYQQDFVRAVLTEPTYTIEGAKAALNKALKKEVK